jgi:hypothetical protein
MKGWKLVTLAVAVGVVLVFAGVAIARGATGGAGGWGFGRGMMQGVAAGDQVRACGGAGAKLMGNGDFRADMLKLREEHRAEMQAWWDKYGSDTSRSGAQKALEELRTEHWNDMRALMRKYGVDLPAARPEGRGRSDASAPGADRCFGGGCGGQRRTAGQTPSTGTGMMGGGMMGAGAL